MAKKHDINRVEKRSRFGWRFWLLLAGCITLLSYLVAATIYTFESEPMRVVKGVVVEVDDTLNTGFVKPSEIMKEIGRDKSVSAGMKVSALDLEKTERTLNALDKVEWANAVLMTNDTVYVTVRPMQPVFRVFESGNSYYFNRSGKVIKADARYHRNVPVVSITSAPGMFEPFSLLPLVEYMENSPSLRDLFSLVEVRSQNDIYLHPDFRGQVVLFGGLEDMEDKFERLEKFYKEVMPYKGWDCYDTLSVKWRGQLVATRREKTLPQTVLEVEGRPVVEEGEFMQEVNQ